MLRFDSFEKSCVEGLTLLNSVVAWCDCYVDGNGRGREAGLDGEDVDVAAKEEPSADEKKRSAST